MIVLYSTNRPDKTPPVQHLKRSPRSGLKKPRVGGSIPAHGPHESSLRARPSAVDTVCVAVRLQLRARTAKQVRRSRGFSLGASKATNDLGTRSGVGCAAVPNRYLGARTRYPAVVHSSDVDQGRDAVNRTCRFGCGMTRSPRTRLRSMAEVGRDQERSGHLVSAECVEVCWDLPTRLEGTRLSTEEFHLSSRLDQ